MSSSLCLKHFSSMTQAHCIYLYCSLDLTFWLCLNRCTEDSPPCPRFCRRYFVTAAQCPCIPVSMTVSSKHRRRDICAPDPHLRPHGSGCTDSPLIPDLGLSRSHSAFLTPQFWLSNSNSCPWPSPLHLRCLDSVGLGPWYLSYGFLVQVLRLYLNCCVLDPAAQIHSPQTPCLCCCACTSNKLAFMPPRSRLCLYYSDFFSILTSLTQLLRLHYTTFDISTTSLLLVFVITL